MHTFKDNQEREWPVVVNVTTVRDCRDILGVDILQLADGEDVKDGLIVRVLADQVLLVDILYVVCKKALDAAKVDDRAFGEALGGDCLSEAVDALLAEIINFSPNPRDRERQTKVLELVKGIIDQTADHLDKRIDPEKVKKTTEKMLKSLG